MATFAWRLFPRGLPPGNEATVFEALDHVILRSWALYGRFPLWNPYLRSGMPVVGDPMLHFANPLVGLPVALLDVGLGFRVGIALSLLAAALGMWSLAGTLEIRGTVRIWMSLLYAFSGPVVARFYQGQYLFVFGCAWIPWVLAAFIRLARTRLWRDAGWAALALAMLFLSGNAYYTFFAIPALSIVFLAFGGVRIRGRAPFVAADKKLAMLFASAGVLFLLFVSVQLLPMFEIHPRMVKGLNLDMSDSQTVPEIFRDLVSAKVERSDTVRKLTTEEFYAYIGIVPLALLALLPFAFRAGHRRAAIAFLGLLLYAVAWIDIAQMPWRSAYRSLAWLHQFRYPTRMLIFVVLAVLVLAGLGADSVSRFLRTAAGGSERSATGRRLAAAALLAGGIAVLAASVFQVFRTNRPIVAVVDEPPRWNEPLDSLRAFDRGEYSMAADGEYQPVIARGFHDLWSWYHWDFLKPVPDRFLRRSVIARPEYLVRGIADGPLPSEEPALADPVQVFRAGKFAAYHFPHALPYAFAAERHVLEEDRSRTELFRDEVVPIRATYRNTDTVEVTAEARREGWIVLMVAHYPGWTVSVDGRPARLRDADGYLGADLLSGRHRYVFVFEPITFRVGLALSLAGAAGILGLLWLGDSRRSSRD